MELEDLVPPMELCKQIPAGKFEDSTLVWAVNGSSYFVEQRELIEYALWGRIVAPAPTLQEILADLAKDGLSPKIHAFMHGENLMWNIASEKYGESAAEIALKLWFELTAEKSDKSDRSDKSERD